MKKRIVFASHDPGGCNLLIPIIEVLSNNPNFTIFLLMAGPAKEKAIRSFGSRVISIELFSFPFQDFPNEYDVDSSELQLELERIRPNIIFTSTSINSNIERYSIQYGNKSGIPTISYIDSWIGQDIRFKNSLISVVPDKIMVCDKSMYDSYLAYEQNGASIHLVGNIHLEMLSNRYTNVSNDKDDKRILFVTENILHYFPHYKVNEFTIIEEMLKVFSGPNEYILSIRPHPLESKEMWEYFIREKGEINKYLQLELNSDESITSAIENANWVIGISSMALIEASILKKPTFSYQVIVDNQDMYYIPFHLYNIHPIYNNGSLTEIMNNRGKYAHLSHKFKFPFEGAEEKIMNIINNL